MIQSYRCAASPMLSCRMVLQAAASAAAGRSQLRSQAPQNASSSSLPQAGTWRHFTGNHREPSRTIGSGNISVSSQASAAMTTGSVTGVSDTSAAGLGSDAVGGAVGGTVGGVGVASASAAGGVGAGTGVTAGCGVNTPRDGAQPARLPTMIATPIQRHWRWVGRL